MTDRPKRSARRHRRQSTDRMEGDGIAADPGIVAVDVPVETDQQASLDESSTPLPELDDREAAELQAFAAAYPFALDRFQVESISSYLRDESVLVAAPTGSGKTVVAEFGVFHTLRHPTGRVFYTTPIKALSNQKFRDLRTIYGNDVGLLTGDVSENRDARILVMTTEIFRNMLLQTPWEADDVATVIFDEVHYLADPDRGTTWEEAIILCPEHIQLICLSATVSNAQEIADWVTRTHRPVRLVTHNQRAVPLSLEYFTDGKLQTVIDHRGDVINDFSRSRTERRAERRHRDGGRTPKFDRTAAEPKPAEIVAALREENRLPAIYFLFSRNDCQLYAEALAANAPSLATPEQEQRIREVVATHLSDLNEDDDELEQVRVITRLVRRGIGFHHAGLLPILKQLVEVLFGLGLMQVVFATDTLALGVNMPARTVVVGRMSKWDGRRRRMLISNEFQQMAGRAGRRGMDLFGHVVVPFSPFVPFDEMMQIATGALEPVRSAFAIRYNTVLNLWDPPDGDRVAALLRQSLAEYQSSQRVREIERDLLEIGGDIVAAQASMDPPYEEIERELSAYRDIVAALTDTQRRLREARNDLELANDHGARSAPWPEPTRQQVRQALRQQAPGLVLHIRNRGWGVFLGRGAGDGIGLFLIGHAIESVAEYRDIDFDPIDARVSLPDALIEPPELVRNATDLVSDDELRRIHDEVADLGLPDLAAIRADHDREEGRRLEDRRRVLGDQVMALEQEERDLIRMRDQHPLHDRSVRREYQRRLADVDRLFQERAAFEAMLTREEDAEDARVRGVIHGIRDVLHRFGYLRRGVPTEKADMLAGVFDNDGLIICEMIDHGWLDHLRPADLAEVFSWYCFDRDTRFDNHYGIAASTRRLRERMDELEVDVLSEEHIHGLQISGGHNDAFHGAVRAWCDGSTMVEIRQTIDLSEGDLVLTFNKTIDLMRQFRDMLRDIIPDSPLIPALRQAETLMRRGIVEQSLTIGFAPDVLPDAADRQEIVFSEHAELVEDPEDLDALVPGAPRDTDE